MTDCVEKLKLPDTLAQYSARLWSVRKSWVNAFTLAKFPELPEDLMFVVLAVDFCCALTQKL